MLQVRARYPWALVPTKNNAGVEAAKRSAAMYAENFRWMRMDRMPDLCWPWRLGHEIGWTIPSPVDIRMDRIDDMELAADMEGLEGVRGCGGVYCALASREEPHRPP